MPTKFTKRLLRGTVPAILAASISLSACWAGDLAKAPPVSEDRIEVQTVTAEMDGLYDTILQNFKDDTVFIAKMQAAQVAWVRYRDAQIEALYPAENKTLVYGSAYNRCRHLAIAALTRLRIEQLRQWLDGVAEGDVCAGSLPIH